jgi:hypothetical protein
MFKQVVDPGNNSGLLQGSTDERDIWEVTHVTEEDFDSFETTESESEDLYNKLMEMSCWTVTDKDKENDLT